MAPRRGNDRPTNKRGSFTRTIVWILLGLLIAGLGGFGVTNFGSSLQAIGSVDDEEITVNEYAIALQQELRALGEQTGRAVSLGQADTLSLATHGAGVSERILRRLYATAALDAEADRIGISVGDETVRDRIVGNPVFQGIDGSFDRESYRFTLRQNGLSEREYENSVREDISRTILQGAVAGNVAAPETLTDSLLEHAAERRSFRWIALRAEDSSDYSPPAPSEADLRAHYEANPDEFTVGEKRRLTYVWLTPEMLLDTIDADEDALRTMYEQRADEYRRPERRLVERLAFESEAAAAAAHDRLVSGDTTFDALVEERGLTLPDIDLGDQSEDELEGAAEAVFALSESGDVTSPQPSPVGPAIFRMNGILNAVETSFEDVRDDLVSEYSLDRARRVIAGLVSEIEDLLAGGATLEEIANETDMILGQISWPADSGDGIADYEEFREAADSVDEDAFPELTDLGDGGLFALRLDEIAPPFLRPFEEAREDIAQSWTRSETQSRLDSRAGEIVRQIEDGAGIDSFDPAVRTETDLTRDAFIEETPPSFMSEVFDMSKGEARAIPSEGAAMVVLLDDILPPDREDPYTDTLSSAIAAGVSQGIASDLFAIYVQALQQQARVSRDQSAINAIHAQFP